MQGHNYSNFSNPQVQPMLLRGIAWAAKRSVDTLMQERPARGRGTNTEAAAAGRGRGN
jgi:type 1 glutamine amidotransferase